MSRFLDERGRILGKVNIVDILVLLVIIAVVAFAVVRMTGSSTETAPLRVTYTVEAVRQASVDQLQEQVQVKGTVRDEGGTVLGTVEEVVVRPSQESYLTPQGELKAFDSPIFKDVDIVLLGEGSVSSSTIRIGSVPMRVGKKVTLIGAKFEVQSVIMDVVSGAEALK
ncbi:MAG: DUF4330 domain-containing protein [bacterium]